MNTPSKKPARKAITPEVIDLHAEILKPFRGKKIVNGNKLVRGKTYILPAFGETEEKDMKFLGFTQNEELIFEYPLTEFGDSLVAIPYEDMDAYMGRDTVHEQIMPEEVHELFWVVLQKDKIETYKQGEAKITKDANGTYLHDGEKVIPILFAELMEEVSTDGVLYGEKFGDLDPNTVGPVVLPNDLNGLFQYIVFHKEWLTEMEFVGLDENRRLYVFYHHTEEEYMVLCERELPIGNIRQLL